VLLSAQWGGSNGIEAQSLGPLFLQCFDTVCWVFWPIKPVPDMTYNVFGGTLNLAELKLILILSSGTRFMATFAVLFRTALVHWCLILVCAFSPF